MNILILGDSLSFPRDTYTIKETWPSLLQRNILKKIEISDHLFWFRAKGGSDICNVLEEIYTLSGYVQNKEFDFVIVQVGVVDCTPRPYSNLILKFLNSNKLGLKIKTIIHKHIKFFYLFYSKPNLSIKIWKNKIEETAIALNKIAKQTIFLSIAPPGERFCKKVPKIESIIQTYNTMLFETVNHINVHGNIRVINPYEDNNFDTTTDIMQNCGHHLTVEGHIKVSKKIVEFIVSCQMNL